MVLIAGACRVDDPAPQQALTVAMAAPAPVVDDVPYGPTAEQVIDVIRPTGRPSNRRAVVWLHGGGWIFGDENGLPPLLGAMVQQEGYTVFSVRYRLAPGSPYPAAVHDVDLAMRWVKAHGGEYAIDTKRLVTMGFSSGAHLALLQGLASESFTSPDTPAELAAIDPSPAGIVALAPPIDLVGFASFTEGGRDMALQFLGCPSMEVCNPDTVWAATPGNHADLGDPIVYVAQGDLDHVVPVGPTDAIVADWEAKLGLTRFWYDRVDSGDPSVRNHDLDYGINRQALAAFIATVPPR